MSTALALLLCQLAAPALLSDAQKLPAVHGAHFPTISPDGSAVAFAYRGDIWAYEIGGRAARRLTIHEANEYRPVWSPDGKYIAFCSDRYGNNDVYVVPAEGGTIARLTQHAANDRVIDWSPDGRKLLLATSRDTRFAAPYVLDIETAKVVQALDDVYDVTPGTFASNGADFVCTRKGTAWWRMGYRGSTNGDVFFYDAAADTMQQLTDFDGRDEWPMLSPDDSTVYFVSERDGAPNLFALSRASGDVRQLTDLDDGGVLWPNISEDGSTIVFEHAEDLWTISTGGGEPDRVLPRIAVDYPENFETYRTLDSGVDEQEVSPDGKYLAARVNGDILLLKPEFKDDSIRLTDDPADDSDFMWSPDSKSLVFTSTRSGNRDLFVADVETLAIRQLTHTDAYEHRPKYGPKGEWVYFTRSDADGLYRIPPGGGDIEEVHPGPFLQDYSISPCGHWLLLQKEDQLSTADLWIMPMDDPSAEVNITKYPGGNYGGWWEPNGEHVFFLSSRDGGSDIYSIRLTVEPEEFDDYEAQQAEKDEKEAEKPGEGEKEATPEDETAQPEVEGEEAVAEAAPEGEVEVAPEEPVAEEPEPEPEPEPIDIDFTNIERRSTRLTSTGEGEGALTLAPKGDKLVYTITLKGEAQVWQINLDGTDAKPFVQSSVSAEALRFTSEGDRLYYISGGRPNFVGGDGGRPESVSFRTEFVEGKRELQIAAFEQAWQALDEQFYDGDFHGVDWDAVHDKYAAQVDGTLTADEFNSALSRMCGELNASHLGCYGGGRSGPDTGRLGLSFDESYAGPGLLVTRVLQEGPCTKAESKVGEGEYVLQINGEDVAFSEDVFEGLKDTTGKRVKLTVNTEPVLEGARTVSVKPISGGAWGELRYEQWIRECRERVAELSDGRFYYMHIRSMDETSLERFRRELFGEAQLYEGLVLDIRYNGGGRIHDPLLEELTKKVHALENVRNAPKVTQPIHLYDKPIVLVINEHCASDAEIFPNGFREKGLGTIVGMPTYGGVIGTYDITLVNGHTFRVPVAGWHALDGTNLENNGVVPDIYAPFDYEAHRDGRDPQLEAAVEQLFRDIGEGDAPA